MKVGGGLSLQYTSTDVAPNDGSPAAKVQETVAVPLASVHVGYRFGPHWHVYGETALQPFGDNSQIDTSLFLRYHFNEHWDMGVGYRRLDRDVDTSDYTNELTLHQALLGFGYEF